MKVKHKKLCYLLSQERKKNHFSKSKNTQMDHKNCFQDSIHKSEIDQTDCLARHARLFYFDECFGASSKDRTQVTLAGDLVFGVARYLDHVSFSISDKWILEVM